MVMSTGKCAGSWLVNSFSQEGLDQVFWLSKPSHKLKEFLCCQARQTKGRWSGCPCVRSYSPYLRGLFPGSYQRSSPHCEIKGDNLEASAGEKIGRSVEDTEWLLFVQLILSFLALSFLWLMTLHRALHLVRVSGSKGWLLSKGWLVELAKGYLTAPGH